MSPGDPLLAELGRLRRLLRGAADGTADADDPGARRAPDAADGDADPPATPELLDALACSFRLSDFERAVLLLAIGPELDPGCAADLAAATGSAYLTFSLALRVLPGAHWSALAPSAPLRRWRLVAPLDPASPVRSPLVADERVLHHLVGVDYLDPRVAALGFPVQPLRVPAPPLVDAAARVAAAWQSSRIVHVAGPRPADVAQVAAAAARGLGRDLVAFGPTDLPDGPRGPRGTAPAARTGGAAVRDGLGPRRPRGRRRCRARRPVGDGRPGGPGVRRHRGPGRRPRRRRDVGPAAPRWHGWTSRGCPRPNGRRCCAPASTGTPAATGRRTSRCPRRQKRSTSTSPTSRRRPRRRRTAVLCGPPAGTGRGGGCSGGPRSSNRAAAGTTWYFPQAQLDQLHGLVAVRSVPDHRGRHMGLRRAR